MTPLALGIMSAALLSLWLWREWPAWPALACLASGTAALMIARRSTAVANWPGQLGALAGLLDAAMWFVLIRTLGTGLDPAVESLARAAVLPALAIGPVLVMRLHPAGLPYAVGQCAGLVVAGCWSLTELAHVPPVSGSMWWPVLAGMLLGLGPLAWIMLKPSAGGAISLAAIGLVYVSYNGAPALATVWAEKQLRNPAIYAASKATREDLQDAYAVFAITPGVVDRVMVRVPNGDWSRGGDFIEAYTITSGIADGSDPRGRIFSVKSAEPHGDLLLSRDVTLTEIGTRAKPLTGWPLVLEARFTRTQHPEALSFQYSLLVGLFGGMLAAWLHSSRDGLTKASLVLSLGICGSVAVTEPGWSAVAVAALLSLYAFTRTWAASRPALTLLDLGIVLWFTLLMLDLDRTW